MTMLASFYPAQGIIFATDSQVTIPGAPTAQNPQQKVMRVHGVGLSDAVLGSTGSRRCAASR